MNKFTKNPTYRNTSRFESAVQVGYHSCHKEVLFVASANTLHQRVHREREGDSQQGFALLEGVPQPCELGEETRRGCGLHLHRATRRQPRPHRKAKSLYGQGVDEVEQTQLIGYPPGTKASHREAETERIMV